jgi:hypothetical protein
MNLISRVCPILRNGNMIPDISGTMNFNIILIDG